MRAVVIVSIIVLLFSCKKEEPAKPAPDPVVTYRIGQEYGGGVIFYMDSTGKHGLIAANEDQAINCRWGCAGDSTGTGSVAIGSGKENTDSIVSKLKNCIISSCAAKIASELSLNGYDDWYLPSKDELNLLFEQRIYVGINGFSAKGYWSSTEYDKMRCYVQSFDNSNVYLDQKNNNTSNIRCIRSF